MFQDRVFKLRRSVLAAAALLVACAAPGEEPAQKGKAGAGAVAGTHVVHKEERFGVPTFVWLEPGAAPPAGTRAADAAWQVLRELAGTYRLGDAALAATSLAGVHDTGRGAVVAQFEQRLGSRDVFRLRLTIALNRNLQPVAASGYLAPRVRPLGGSAAVDQKTAVAVASQAMAQRMNLNQGAAGLLAGLAPVPATPPRSRITWFPRPDGLVPAYYVELDFQKSGDTDSELRSFVISALDGSVLYEKDLTAADAVTYRVWADKDKGFTPWDGPQGTAMSPHPTGLRDDTLVTYLPSQLVTLPNAPFSRNDPWLPPGATEARGNNAIAYADLSAPDGLSAGDLPLVMSGPSAFDYGLDVRTEDPAGSPTAIKAVTTNFFYTINFMHDYFYDAGWDESSYNPQQDNYGRGGIGGDPIRAEAQDSSGRNNANASTPEDGASPRIQMYLWDPTRRVRIDKPASLSGLRNAGNARFGPRKFEVTEDVVAVDDGTGKPSDGCETPFVNAAAVAGKIALVDRASCPYQTQTWNAQQNGAVGVIVVNNVPGSAATMGTVTPAPATPITVPALMLSQADGEAVKAALASGETVRLGLEAPYANNDSSLDTTIIAHEWGHVLSGRLVGNGNGLDNQQGAGMGEGWSDFVALLTIMRPEDAVAAANANWSGVYPVSVYSSGPWDNAAYDGIRRYPYSTDLAKSPLTYKHIQNGVALPAAPAPSFGQSGANNSEVHATGEIWAQMLYDCYVALLRDTARYSFEQANRTMRDYLVAGLKLTPVSPTILEARDALLAAAYANSAEDYRLFVEAFSRRGAGPGAVGPGRSSSDNTGVSESFSAGADFSLVELKLDDSVHGCDRDGVLDNGEVGRLTIKLRNTGSVPLSATAGLSFSSPAVTEDAGGHISFPTVPPYMTTSASVNLSLAGAPLSQPIEVKLDIDVANKAVPGTVTIRRTFWGNFDVEYGSASSDTMDDANPVWNSAADPELDTSEPWRHNGEKGYWSILDTAAPSDHYLTSPPLAVSKTGSFGFTLRHRYSFEADAMTRYDGAVIEVSDDNGKTWKDAGMQLVSNGYDGTLWKQNEPLANRQAFTARSAGYPSFIDTVADFGTAYQGKTVRLRFRIGTDPASGGPGWDLDELRLTGVDNKPFSTRVLKHGDCTNRPPELAAGAEKTVAPGELVTLTAAATDPDGDPLSYRWTQKSGPSVMLSGYASQEATFTAPEVSGDEPVELHFAAVANDGTVDSAPVVHKVSVTPRATPKPAPSPPAPRQQSGCAMAPAGGGAGSAGALLAAALLLGAALARRRLALLLALAAGCSPPEKAPEQYTLLVSVEGSGSVVSQPAGIDCGQACAALYKAGTQVTLTAAAAKSSQFGGWKGACTGSQPMCTVSVDMTRSVTAIFTGQPALLRVEKSGDGDGTVESAPSGLSCGATCEGTFSGDTLITLRARPDSQSVFTGWSGDCQGAKLECTVHTNISRTVTARFDARICTSDGLCWERPSPQGNALHAVQVLGAGDVWAAGAAGMLVHWDGKRWRAVDSGTKATLRGLWAAGPADIWAVGDGGTILHWDGKAWSQAASGATADLYAVWGPAAGDVWAVGDQGTALHFDGSAWTAANASAAKEESLRAIHGSGPKNIFVVSTGGSALRWDGTSWTRSVISQRRLLAVWAGAENSAWAVGDNGAALRWDGTSWTAKAVPTSASLTSVYGANADAVWITSSANRLWRRDGSAWRDMNSLVETALYASHGDASGQWFVGDRGAMVRWDGSLLSPVSAGSEARGFAAVYSSDENNLWLAGAGGLIGHLSGAELATGDSGTSSNLLALHGSGNDNVWAVGERGAAVRYADRAWQDVSAPLPRTLYAVYTLGAADTWAVGELGTVLHHDGKAWRTRDAGVVAGDLYAVWSSGPTDVWVGGTSGLYHHDGKAWSRSPSVAGPVYALAGRAANDLLAAGGGGSLQHFDGAEWHRLETGTTANLRAIALAGPNKLWIAGEQGTVLKGSSSSLTQAKSGTSGNLYSAAAADEHGVWLLGSAGLLSYRR